MYAVAPDSSHFPCKANTSQGAGGGCFCCGGGVGGVGVGVCVEAG